MTVLGARTTAVMTAEHGESRAAAPLHHAGRMLAVSDAVAARSEEHTSELQSH